MVGRHAGERISGSFYGKRDLQQRMYLFSIFLVKQCILDALENKIKQERINKPVLSIL